jgi:hypothetical protein
MRVNDDGDIEPGALRGIRNIFAAETEPDECRKAASLVGRWFGKMDTPSLILTLWGLQP